MSLKLTEYLPDPSDLDPTAIIETRKRLETYLARLWPALDTRPNSVFGDIYLTPAAALMTVMEVAMERFKSDLDLSNVSSGKVYDVEFVTAFLKNFGVTADRAINASGTIKLTFDADLEYVLDSGITFTFGNAVFFFNPEEGNPIYIKPTTQPDARRVLTRTGEEQYEIFMPVMGTPGATINDGDQARASVTIEHLVSITAMGTMDSGRQVDNIISMADRAQRQFSAASMASRSGVISFCSGRWPDLIGISATVTGDREMLRGGLNPLGVFEGAVDVFVKSSKTLAQGEAIVPLTYDVERQAWIGRLTLPVVPSFYNLNEGIFQTNDFQTSRGVHQIFGKSVHPTTPNVGVSYSRYEVLGVAVKDTNPTDFKPAVTGQAQARTATSTGLEVRGEYNGGLFSQYGSRSVNIRFDAATTVNGVPAIRANARDSVSGEVAVIYFVANDVSQPTRGIVLKDSPGYLSMFSGLDLDVVPAGAVFVPETLVGLEYTFAYSGRVANFSVNYLYDPFLVQVDEVIGNVNHKPVNADPVARSFITCHITQFTINYRTRYGRVLDVDSARSAIVDYLNSLAYPRQYEDSVVSTLLARYGADGVQSITKKGYFYPSLAATYVSTDGSETSVPRIETSTLLPALNNYGYGQRNIGYFVESDTLTFNGTAY